jgi:putative aldouronate transport system substrate-binding protein
MTKKILSLLLVLTMVLSLAACGSTGTPAASSSAAPAASSEAAPAESSEAAPEASSEPVAELEPYELTYYMISSQVSNQDAVVEEAINKIIQPKFNATIDFVMVTFGDWEQKARVPLQAGEKIDIFFTPEWLGFMSNLNSNLLLALDDPNGPAGDLINTYAPQTAKDLGAFYDANIVNGNLYSVPVIKELCVPGGLIWNQDYVDKYNIDINSIMTPADLEPVLADFAKNEPGVKPLLSTGGWSAFDPFIQGFLNNMEPISIKIGTKDTQGNLEPEYYWEDQSTVDRCYTMEKWYNAGYLEADSYLSTFNNMDFLNAGKFLVSTDFVLKGGQVKANELMAQSGNSALRLAEVQTSESVNVTTHAGGSMLGIPITSQDPARAMMYINEMYQNTELLNTMAWGIEGTHYDLNPEGYVIPKDKNGWSDSHGGMWTLGNQFKQLIAANEDPNKYKQMSDLTAQAWNHESLGFRFLQAPVENEYAAIKNVTDTYSRSMRTGVGVTENYDKMLQALKDAGVEKVMAEVKSQYSAWKASK